MLSVSRTVSASSSALLSVSSVSSVSCVCSYAAAYADNSGTETPENSIAAHRIPLRLFRRNCFTLFLICYLLFSTIYYNDLFRATVLLCNLSSATVAQSVALCICLHYICLHFILQAEFVWSICRSFHLILVQKYQKGTKIGVRLIYVLRICIKMHA